MDKMDKMDKTKEAIVVGSQLSTFTRTICMGLMLKGVGFSQVLATPHSKDAKEHHPMGRVPSFYHTGRCVNVLSLQRLSVFSHLHAINFYLIPASVSCRATLMPNNITSPHVLTLYPFQIAGYSSRPRSRLTSI